MPERRLTMEQEFKSMLLDEALDSIFILDLDGNILFANKSAFESRGYTEKDILGMSLADLDSPPYRRQLKMRLARLLKSGRMIMESEHICKDGSIMSVEIHARVIEFADHKFFFSIVRDISDRKRVEKFNKALNQINQAINSTLDSDEIMTVVVSEATKAIGAESGVVLLKEDEHLELKYTHGLPPNLIGRQFDESRAIAIKRVLASKRASVFNDTFNDDRIDPDVIKALNIRSMCVAPLVVKEEAIGSLCFFYHSKPTIWRNEQVDFARQLSASLALSVANANLFAAEQNIADTLQEALLAVAETIDGVEFGHLYKSATETIRVGGDFYDIFETPGGKVAIVIGDVSGKGLGAAGLTSIVKNSLKAFSYHETSPSAILSKTNDVVVKASDPSTFVTLFLGLLDTSTGSLSYCGAGHPPALLRKESGVIEPLNSLSTAIGIFPQIDFTDRSVFIAPNDILVLYTDGVTDARTNQTFFGDDRLINFISNAASDTAATLPNSIFENILDFTGETLLDDVAMLAVSLKS